MKYFLILTFMITGICCNESGYHKNDHAIKSDLIDTLITDNKNIIGLWKMCSKYEYGVMINYNVCAQLYFETDGTCLIMLSNDIGNFTWTFKKNILKISNTDKNSNQLFSATSYTASISKAEGSLELQIQSIQNDEVFYLYKNNTTDLHIKSVFEELVYRQKVCDHK